jgi:ABC-2 type transport system permease protein
MSLPVAQGGIELRQFFRTRESLVFTLLFPIMLMVIFGSIFKGIILNEGQTPEVTLSQYFVCGMIASGLLATGFQNLAISIPIERDRGVLKRYMGTPMPKWIYFAGKVLSVSVLAVVATILLLVVAVSFYNIRLPDTAAKWGIFAWVTALSLISFTLLGIAFSSAARTGRSAPAVVTPVALVLQFTSGVFFPFYQLPSWMQHFAAIFPLKWATQGYRAVFLPDSFAAREVAHSWELNRIALVLGAWCVGGLILCLLTFRWTTKRDG